MSNNSLSAINIVYSVEKSQREHVIAASGSSTVSLQQFEDLLNKGIETFSTHQIARDITDRPFEIFWTNPAEPRHSKLLAYFLNPGEAHGFGEDFLKSFLHGLPRWKFEADKLCEVQDETGHIDLLITRRAANNTPSERIGTYAIIIENKVNGARDQPEQLQRYYEKLLGTFEKDEIYVYYLPLFSGMACANSIGNITNVEPINFRDHIAKWLGDAIDSKKHVEEPNALAMSQNLQHYLNLINYLLKQEKATIKVNNEIFEQLTQVDEGMLPTLKNIQDLQGYARALELNFRKLMHRRILNRVYEILLRDRRNVRYYDSNETKPTDEKCCGQPFQDPTRIWHSVGIELADDLLVTFTIVERDVPCWWIACRPLNWEKQDVPGYLKLIDPDSRCLQNGQAAEWSYFYEQSDEYLKYISWEQDAERVARRLIQIANSVQQPV